MNMNLVVYDLKQQRGKVKRVLREELEILNDCLIALSRTPAKVQVTQDLLHQVCERLQALRDELSQGE